MEDGERCLEVGRQAGWYTTHHGSDPMLISTPPIPAQLIASQAVATPASQESEPVAVAKKEPPIQPPAKRAKPEKKRADEGAKAPEPKPVVKTPALTDQGSQSGGARRQLSSATLRLREMCKRATIGIAPSIYVQNKTDAGLQEALVNLLTKHGLSKSSGTEQSRVAFVNEEAPPWIFGFCVLALPELQCLFHCQSPAVGAGGCGRAQSTTQILGLHPLQSRQRCCGGCGPAPG